MSNILIYIYDFPGGSDGKASAYNVGGPGSIPGSGRSPGEGNANPLQYSCLENGWKSLVGYSPQGHKILGLSHPAEGIKNSYSVYMVFGAS